MRVDSNTSLKRTKSWLLWLGVTGFGVFAIFSMRFFAEFVPCSGLLLTLVLLGGFSRICKKYDTKDEQGGVRSYKMSAPSAIAVVNLLVVGLLLVAWITIRGGWTINPYHTAAWKLGMCEVLEVALMVFTCPIGWLSYAFVPVSGPPLPAIIFVPLNAYFWGYGLAAAFRYFRKPRVTSKQVCSGSVDTKNGKGHVKQQQSQARGVSGRRLVVDIALRVPLLLLWLIAGLILARVISPLPASAEERKNAAIKHLFWLRETVRNRGAASQMQGVFPEGACFTVTLYGLSWTNLVNNYDISEELRQTAIAEASWAVEQYDQPYVAFPFVATQVRNGVFWLGL